MSPRRPPSCDWFFRLRPYLSVVALGCVSGLLLLAAPAGAAKVKEYVPGKGLTGYTFVEPRGVAINQATGDVYVSDEGVSPVAIEQFSASGAWLSSTVLPTGSGETFQVAVDNSCFEHKLSGGACASFDPSDGDVYIGDVSNGVVYKFDPNANGELTLDATTPKIPLEGEPALGEPRGVAVDSTGDVYISSGETVSKFSSTGALLQENLLTGLLGPRGLALDAAGDIYVAGEIGYGAVEYSSTGTCVNACKPFNLEFDGGVTLDSGGDVFITDHENGTVHEYGRTAKHSPIENPALEAPNAVVGPGGVAVNDTTHVLYVAERNGAAVVRVFNPVDAAPTTAKTEPATPVTGAVEALRGTINPGDETTEYYFEYGTEPCDALAETCGVRAIEQSAGPIAGEAPLPVSVSLDTLAPNTTYHYWVVASHEEAGVEHGEEQTFTTGSGSPQAKAPKEVVGRVEVPAAGEVSPYPNLTAIAPVPGPKTATKPRGKTSKPKACKRGFARKHGKCVRRPKKKTAKGR
jgi:DNA-binding beta-propeller fold protein YncE